MHLLNDFLAAATLVILLGAIAIIWVTTVWKGERHDGE